MMKENKNNIATVRFTDTEKKALQKIIDDGKAKTYAGAIQYLVLQHIILGK
ncbi:hypothetical protein [Scandinavium lactucae]|uniref:Uncharacterized protein n=1 Tax=Scandinavium lactucae TaxID=3095028 RepID=A0ABU4QX35_9ENTR|nr:MULTISPECIES: hypothetical protein [unclassified Scandinavium]MDX6042818.1 hypothetical protein [Scandinavium sp. V105_6]MDX6052819.1 hypothetical protein [Scandinavium sp. V105_1]